MPWLSDDRMWEVFGTRGLFQASYGAADFGECRLAVDRVGAGGADDWYREWAALADGLVETADADAEAGRPASARDGYLRATTYYRVAYLPLYGEPTDPRLADAFARESDALAGDGKSRRNHPDDVGDTGAAQPPDWRRTIPRPEGEPDPFRGERWPCSARCRDGGPAGTERRCGRLRAGV